MLNEDARSRWLGRDNVGYATIKGKQMPVLLDTGANVNMITPECVVALGLQMGPLTNLCEGDITIDQPFNYEGRPIGYIIMSVHDRFQNTANSKLGIYGSYTVGEMGL